MNAGAWIKGVRLTLGFLLAPMIVPIWLIYSAEGAIAYLGLEPNDTANIILAYFLIVMGELAYFCALGIGIPYVAGMICLRRLNLWTLMAATSVAALVYAAVVYFSFEDQCQPFAKLMAILSVPGVILEGLCFYFIAVWRWPGRRQADAQGNAQAQRP